MYVLSIKVPIRKKSGNLFNDPRILLSRFLFVSLSKASYLLRFSSLLYFCESCTRASQCIVLSQFLRDSVLSRL